MNIKQKIVTLTSVIMMGIGTIMFVGQPAYAKCGDAETSIINCDANNKSKSAKDNAIWKILLLVLNIMTGGVGVLAVAGIAYGGIMYASSGDKPEQTKKAIGVITNVVIGVVAYAFMFLLLNFLIPGGIFS